jgi:hypothetical protein
VGREGLCKHHEIASDRRRGAPFRILVADAGGAERADTADVVLDCTGTYGNPNSLGDGGIPAPGERALSASITRHLPDFEREAPQWLDRGILLVGGGHSAQTAAVALSRLAAARGARETRVVWIPGGRVREAVEDDPLPERAALLRAAGRLLQGGSPHVEARRGWVVDRLAPAGERLAVTLVRRSGDGEETLAVDRILSLTGYVGDPGLYRQLQVHECYATGAPMKLSAALLGQASGDCLAQAAQGADTLVHPEPGFHILGIKSYGRIDTFLMRVGWSQVDEVFEILSS